MTTQISDESRTAVECAVGSISHIATLPEVTLRIVELVENSASTVEDLHGVIAHDPALCSRILKVVNSAFYGAPRQVASISRAVALLGLNAVKNIAIASSLTKLVRGGELCPQFSARRLWSHCFAAGTASKLIADELQLNAPDEAFLAGLIHDIGIMVEMQSDRDGLVQVLERMTFDEDGAPLEDMREVERAVFGADHQTFGAALCEAWKFPRSLVYAAGHHHEPLALPPDRRTLACVVYIADRLAEDMAAGFRTDLPSLEIGEDVLDDLRLSASQLERVRDALPKGIR